MSGLRLIALTRPVTAAEIEAAGNVLAGYRIHCVSHADVTAVLAEPAKAGLFATKRTRLTAEITQAQQIMEAMLKYGPVLAAHHDACVEDEMAALSFLAANHAKLVKLLESTGGYCQFQIDIGWDGKEALSAYRNDPRLTAAIAQAKEDPRLAGMAIHTAMGEIRAELAAKIGAIIGLASIRVQEMKSTDPDLLASFVAVIDPAKESALDHAVAQVDALNGELFKIAYRGPLPALSLACISIEKPSRDTISTARRLLAVTTDATTEEIEGAFRKFIKINHPDMGGDAEAADRGKQARDLLVEIAALPANSNRPEPALLRVSGLDEMTEAA